MTPLSLGMTALLLLAIPLHAAEAPAPKNRLAAATSPYLLQHADNPIAWLPWGDEAFARAKKEDKPIFLSIGYSTCHGCHVMERESFSDPEIGALLDAHFVSIKVDREERPDVDAVYMAAARVLTDEPGWPLNLFLTPEGEAFFAASYLPKKDLPGRIGLATLLPRIAETWEKRRESVEASTEMVTLALRESLVAPPAVLDRETMETAYRELASRYDPVHGGFLPPPKFPSPNELRFLLRWWKRSGDGEALAMVEKTLQALRGGALYDQVGFGVHRYATDAAWRDPHFEKMLYDQALLAIVAVETFQATGNARYRALAEETLGYMLRDLRAPEGAFHAAEDAESEGREGAFYEWTDEELEQILGAEWPKFSTSAPCAGGGRCADVPLEYRERARLKLLEARNRRPRPAKDLKILADWNGLAISALARAGSALDDPAYTEAAARAADFLLARMRNGDGRLQHNFIAGRGSVPGFLDDYAFVIQGLLDLYEASAEVRYLEEAIALERDAQRLFRDDESGAYFIAPDSGRFPIRPMDLRDDELPAGASAQLLNMIRLGRMTADPAYEERAHALLAAVSGQTSRAPDGATGFFLGVDFLLGPSFEIVLAGRPGDTNMKELRRVLFEGFVPSKVVLHRPPGNDARILKLAPFTELQTEVSRQATAYVCTNYACELPTGEPELLRRMIENSSLDRE